MNAPAISPPSFAAGQILAGRLRKNSNEFVRIDDVSPSDGRLLFHYQGGKRRWTTLATALASYRITTEADAVPDYWFSHGLPKPAPPTGNQFTDFAPPRPGLAKGKALAANDEAPTRDPELDYVAEIEGPSVPGEYLDGHPPVEAAPVSEPTPVDATAPDGMALATIEGVSLAVPYRTEGEALIRDITLGERLDLTQPRNIRQAIRDLEKSGRLGQVAQRTQVVRYESRPGIWQSREVAEFWLTEAQTLKVITRSNSDAADRITDEMIRVFMAWRRGQFPPAAPTTALSPQVFDLMQQQMVMLAQGQQMMAQALTTLTTMVQSRPAEPDPKATEALRLKQEREQNARKRADDTRAFTANYPALRDEFFPRLSEFVLTRLDKLDMGQPAQRARCLRSGEVKDLFVAWLRERKATKFPDQRAVFAMLKELSDGVRIAGKGDKEVFLPWGLKLATTTAPAQTGLSFPDRGLK